MPRLKTLAFAALSPEHQEEISKYHREGLSWFFENAQTDTDGITTPPTVAAVTDDSLFAQWLQRDPRAARHTRRILLPLDLRGAVP